MATSEAQKRATQKYMKENLKEIRFRVKKEQAEAIEQFAQSKGLSLRAYLLELIEKDMNKPEQPKIQGTTATNPLPLLAYCASTNL